MSETPSAVETAPTMTTRNPTVQRCLDAAAIAGRTAQRAGGSDYEREKAAQKAYIDAMPDLSGYDNICNFIACVTHAMLTGIIWHEKGTKYLYAAQVALGAVRRPPQKPKAEAA